MSKASLVAALEGSDNDLDTYLELSNTAEIRADICALAASPDVALRDKLAAASMPLAQRDEEASPTDKSYRAVAIRAYHYADAMLKAREQ